MAHNRRLILDIDIRPREDGHAQDGSACADEHTWPIEDVESRHEPESADGPDREKAGDM